MDDMISPEERRRLASLVGCNERFLYQCLTGRNAMNPVDAANAERVTEGRLKRPQLRRKDWHLVWPELVTPEHPAPAEQCARAF